MVYPMNKTSMGICTSNLWDKAKQKKGGLLRNGRIICRLPETNGHPKGVAVEIVDKVGLLSSWAKRSEVEGSKKVRVFKTLYYSLIESLNQICEMDLCQARRRPQGIMEIYGQGRQRSMAQIQPQRIQDFY